MIGTQDDSPSDGHKVATVPGPASLLRRPLWIWPFIAGASTAVAIIAFIGMKVTVETSVRDEAAANTSPCERDRQDLQVAVEAWYAMQSTQVNPTQIDLVAAGYLAAEVWDYILVEDDDGYLVAEPRPNSDCGRE